MTESRLGTSRGQGNDEVAQRSGLPDAEGCDVRRRSRIRDSDECLLRDRELMAVATLAWARCTIPSRSSRLTFPRSSRWMCSGGVQARLANNNPKVTAPRISRGCCLR
jgi:hypothetical protein